jgi:hypothetical protein
VARLLRCRLQGLHRADYWRKQGFPNLVVARAAMAKIRKQRKLEEAARRFSPYADFRNLAQYEALLPPPKPPPRRRRQVYKSRVLGRFVAVKRPRPRYSR